MYCCVTDISEWAGHELYRYWGPIAGHWALGGLAGEIRLGSWDLACMTASQLAPLEGPQISVDSDWACLGAEIDCG